MTTVLPQPRAQGIRRHLGRFTADPLPLMEEGAATGRLFQLRLWRSVVVGYSPDWNRLVLKDLETFRSSGSLSSMTPYLNGGTVTRDAPLHRPGRRMLNPAFHRTALTHLRSRIADTAAQALPRGHFDALDWAAATVQRMLSVAFFDGRFPDRLLTTFLRPLRARPPAALLPRPLLFRRMERALTRAVAEAAPGTLAHALGDVPDAVEEIRVSLAAGFDTTTHTLAWALWHLAGRTEDLDDDGVRRLLDETLRLYPAGWVGSRVTTREVALGDRALPAGQLVMVSPYLTHRDPDLWGDPLRFRPERFAEPLPSWGYLPFLAGERTCLGAHLARLMLESALSAYLGRPLRQVIGDPSPHVTLTLAPKGPLHMHRAAA